MSHSDILNFNLTNKLLRELNEVVLTSANFSNAVGIQQHVKDCVNRAYHDIVSAEPQWSFLATGESGATDPMYGNVSVETVAGQRWYELKAASSSVTTDYGSIDWDDFYPASNYWANSCSIIFYGSGGLFFP